jgi:hypothetical protein
MPTGSLKISVLREVALLVGLVFAGLVLVPIAIYWIGPQLLGEFGGFGFADFFRSLGARIRSGEAAAWFLVLSPYLAVQVLRLTRFGWRSTRQPGP